MQAIGLGYALDYMESIGREAIAAHEESLRAYAHERLSAINSLRIIGNAPGKGSIFSFELAGIHAHDVSTMIDRRGVAVRAGDLGGPQEQVALVGLTEAELEQVVFELDLPTDLVDDEHIKRQWIPRIVAEKP